jgi:hypothetical protein
LKLLALPNVPRRFEGNFVDGKLNGMGAFYARDGTRYEGEFKDNKRHGRGVLTTPEVRISKQIQAQVQVQKPV